MADNVTIERVHFRDFRSLRDVALRLGHLTALVGPNAAGKSTVLRGLRPAFDESKQESCWRRLPRCSQRREVTMSEGSVFPSGAFEVSPGALAWNHAAAPYSHRHLHLDVAALRTTNQVTQATALAENGENLANVLATLPRRVQEAVARDFCKLVPVFADVDVRPLLHGFHRIVFQDRWAEGVWYAPEDVSDGTMLMLAFTLLQHQTDAPDLLTIEEPEHGLHPYLLEQLVRLLRGISTGTIGPRRIQIVLATHSAELLEYLEPEEVRFLSRNDDGSVLIEEAPTKDPDWRRVYEEYQSSLGGLWLAGNLGGVPRGAQ